MPPADHTTGSVLTVNAGSTGVKMLLVDRADRATTLPGLWDAPPGLMAVGHRVVFGGARFTAPVLIDEGVAAALAEQGGLAPLHNAAAVALIREARAALPDVPHVAVFDTAFHATLPDEAAAYAVPEEWMTRWDVRRHGFHGLSVEWASGRATAMLGTAGRAGGGLRLVVCHLGGGASATAVCAGRSVDTSMGFSPLEGLVMATRSGSLDPGVVLDLIARRGMAPEEVGRALNEDSGLLALAGTPDMREVEARADAGDPAALRALAVHDHRLAGTVARLAASLGGLDAVAFTGGVGEGSARVRAEAARRLGFLGMRIDPDRNAAARGDADVSADDATVRSLVVRSREELVIARAARAAVSAARDTTGDLR